MSSQDDIRGEYVPGSSPSTSSSSSSSNVVPPGSIDASLASTIIGSLQALSSQSEEIMCLLRILVHQPGYATGMYHTAPEQKHVHMPAHFANINAAIPLLKTDPAGAITGGWWCSSSQLRYKHTTPIKTSCKQVATELAMELENRQHLSREQLTSILFSVIRSSVEDAKRKIKRDSRANPLVPLILYRAGFPILTDWSAECSADHFRAAVNAIRQYWAKLRRSTLRPYIATRSMQTGGAGATDWLQDCRTLELPQLTVAKCIDLILDFYHHSEGIGLDDQTTFQCADLSNVSVTDVDSLETIALSPIKQADVLTADDSVHSLDKRKRGRSDGVEEEDIAPEGTSGLKIPRPQ